LIGSLVIAALCRSRGLGGVLSTISADSKDEAFNEGASSGSFQIAVNERFLISISFLIPTDAADDWGGARVHAPLRGTTCES